VDTALTFSTVEMTQVDLSEGSLVLVNSESPWHFPAELSLSNVYDNAADAYQLSGTGLQLQQSALWFPAVSRMSLLQKDRRQDSRSPSSRK
jgi:hypothetical protein